MNTNTSYVVFNSDNSVNVEASVEKYRDALETWVITHAENEVTLRESVISILKLSGKNIPLPKLVGMVCVKLQPSADQYDIVSDEVSEFVKNNTGEKGSNALFFAQKGKNGGVGLNV